jgi:hypothetical protein
MVDDRAGEMTVHPGVKAEERNVGVSTDLQPIMRPLTMNEAAAALAVSRRWLQDFLPTIECPYLRCGHKKLFDEAAHQGGYAMPYKLVDPEAAR